MAGVDGGKAELRVGRGVILAFSRCLRSIA
jgi:hypothetical protein